MGAMPCPLESYWWTLAEVMDYRNTKDIQPPPPAPAAECSENGSTPEEASDGAFGGIGAAAAGGTYALPPSVRAFAPVGADLWSPEYFRRKHFAKVSGMRFVVSMQMLHAQAKLGSLRDYSQALQSLCDLCDMFNTNCQAIFEGGLAEIVVSLSGGRGRG